MRASLEASCNMPSLRVKAQQPSPVPAHVELPPEFPPVPQEVIDRFSEAEKWQTALAEFWTRTKASIQSAQTQAANYANSRVVYSVDQFLVYAKGGIPQPMFALDSTGVKLGDTLVISTAGRKVFIGEGVYADDQTPFYVDTLGFFSLGASLTWDPETDTLTITGVISATSGTIGGFDIGADYIRDTANTMGLASTITGGDDVRFWSGDTFANRATAPFRVLESGAIVATSAAITGTISGRDTATIAGAIDASGILITDLINARINTSAKDILSDFDFGAVNYAGALKAGTIAWNTTTGAITGGSGVAIYRGGLVGANAGVATFSIDSVTGNATFAGTLSAPTGNIGGFTLGADYIRDLANSMGLASTVTGGDDVRFWAGATFANRATAPFRITEAGVLTATSGAFTGTITSSAGVIGGFTLSASTLTANTGDNYVNLDSSGILSVGTNGGANNFAQFSSSIVSVRSTTTYALMNQAGNIDCGTFSYPAFTARAHIAGATGLLELYSAGGSTLVSLSGATGAARIQGSIRLDNLGGGGTLYVQTDNNGVLSTTAGPGAGLGGSTGATDNRILRADGGGGSTVQNSALLLDDSGNLSGVGTLAIGGTLTGVTALTMSGDLQLASSGTSTPGSGNTTAGFAVENNGTMYASRASNVAGNFNRNDDGTLVNFIRSGTVVGSVSVTSTTTAYNTTSDGRLKTNVKPMPSVSAIIDAIKVQEYEFTEVPGRKQAGFVAQELHALYPEAVLVGDDEDIQRPWMIDYSKLVPVLMREMQDLRLRLKLLEAN